MLKVFAAVYVVLSLAACASYKTHAPTLTLDKVHPSGAHRIAFDVEGRRLASGGLHGGVSVWSVTDGALLARLEGHKSSIRGLVWLDGDHIVSADKRGLIRVWRLSDRGVLTSLQLKSVQDLALEVGGRWLAVAQEASVIKLDARSLKISGRYELGSPVLSVAIRPSNNHIAVSTRDGRVRLLDDHLSLLRELPKAAGNAYELRFSADGNTLLGGTWFRLLVWDLLTMRLQELSAAHFGKVASVDISPDGRHWLSLGRDTDSGFNLIDAATNQVVRRFQAFALCGWQGRFSPDGRFAAGSSEDGSIYIFDLAEPYDPRTRYMHFED